jgi:hypothetical protein
MATNAWEIFDLCSGSNALNDLVELIKTDDLYEQRDEYWFPETMYTTIENASCAAMFAAQLCNVTGTYRAFLASPSSLRARVAGAILKELCDLGIVGALLTQMKSSDPETAHYCGKALGSIIMIGNGDGELHRRKSCSGKLIPC